MEVQVLASSSAGNAYLVDDGSTPLLLECGLPFRELRRGLRFGLRRIAGCLVTHEHGDHSKAVRDVMKAGIDCYMASGTATALSLDGHRLHIVRPLDQLRIGTWRVLPWEAVHDVECLGFLLASDTGERLLYATDTGYIPNRFRGLTHLLVECNHSEELLQEGLAAGLYPVEHKNRVLRNHLSLERLLGFLAANDLGRLEEVWLLHLSDDNSDEAAFKRAVQRATGAAVYVAQAYRKKTPL